MKIYRPNSDREKIIDDITAKLSPKGVTREFVEKTIIDYEAIFLKYLSQDNIINYQWKLPGTAIFYSKSKKNKKPLKINSNKKKIIFNQYMKIKFTDNL